jgi:hypothetical protein
MSSSLGALFTVDFLRLLLALPLPQDVTTPPRTIRKGGDYIKQVSGQPVKYVEMDGTHITLYHNPELLPAMLEFLRKTVTV